MFPDFERVRRARQTQNLDELDNFKEKFQGKTFIDLYKEEEEKSAQIKRLKIPSLPFGRRKK